MKLKVFIIVFNRLTWTKRLAEYLATLGFEVIIIDNHSDYSPLLEWYETTPFKVHRMDKNYLSNVFWAGNIIDQYPDQYFAITDCDLDLTSVPIDFEYVLMNALQKSDYWKVGLSLEICDLPDNEMTKDVISHELLFWTAPIDEKTGFYRADIATTFAIYDRLKYNPSLGFLSALRAPRPFTAKHLPWYLTQDTLTEEEKYYIRTTQWTGWSKYFKV